MKASVYYGQNDLRIENRPVPEISAGELLIKVDFCGICGTDIKKIQYGLAKGPTVLGHEVTGTVVESRNDRFKAGERVAVAHHVPCGGCHYCRHGNVSMCAQFKSSNLDPGGFSEFCRIPQLHADTTTFALDRLTAEEGIFMEPLACAVRNLDMHRLLPGDVAVCIGLGSMGLLSAQALIARGVTVIGLDLQEDRMARARAFGVAQAWDARRADLRPAILDLTDGRGADLVLITAGRPELVPAYLSWLRPGGALNFFSSLYPEDPAPIPVNELYHREIHITSSYSASPDALREAHRLLESGKVKVKEMITEIHPLAGIMTGIEHVLAGKAIKALVNPALA